MKPIIWLIILVLFGIGEAVTVGLTSIWFALGALGALIVSQLGLVTEEIDNLAGHGLVNIAGQVWSARSAGEGAVIPAGQEVRVTQIQGVKVLVEPVQSGGPEH